MDLKASIFSLQVTTLYVFPPAWLSFLNLLHWLNMKETLNVIIYPRLVLVSLLVLFAMFCWAISATPMASITISNVYL